ncbi:hypothetical protein D4R42_05470 [bacterium]|nr:MAG: hypothetical protein D4R42_05470 [bacterium]
MIEELDIAELVQGKVRAKFFGHHDDDDIMVSLQQLKKTYPQIDNLIEENGRLRKRPSPRKDWRFG